MTAYEIRTREDLAFWERKLAGTTDPDRRYTIENHIVALRAMVREETGKRERIGRDVD